LSARRGIVLVLVLIVVAILVSVAGSLLLMAGTSATPSVANESTLYLKIKAPFSEIEPVSLFEQFSNAQTLRGTLETIRKAKVDRRIKAMVIRLDASGALWGQLQELRGGLVDFRRSGKPVIAYLEYSSAQEYYVASAADRVVMMPAGSLDLTGVASYELFFRGALDKIGAYPDMLHIGEYKTFSNTFTEKGFTPAHREMTRSLNHEWYDQLVKGIADGRRRSEAEIIKAIDGGPYLAERAKAAGLVDDLEYEDQVDGNPPVKGTRRIEGEAYSKVQASSLGLGEGPRIALLYASGTIASGDSSFDSPTGTVLGSETFVQWVRKVRVDPAIRAVVVRIDSPGGSAIASDVIWRELMLTRSVKPLVVSMGNVAASGGYYIAVPADTIVAEPGTITGSIGVISGKMALRGLYEKVGITTEVIARGKNSGLLGVTDLFTESERQVFKKLMLDTYDQFVDKALAGRTAAGKKMSREELVKLAGGRIYTGRQAKANGLIDEVGTLEDALAEAAKLGGLPAGKEPELLMLPKPKHSLEDLLGSVFGAQLGADVQALRNVPGLAEALKGASALIGLGKEPVWAIAPYRLEIK